MDGLRRMKAVGGEGTWRTRRFLTIGRDWQAGYKSSGTGVLIAARPNLGHTLRQAGCK